MSRLIMLPGVLYIMSALACGSTSSTTVAGPSPAKCQLTATNRTGTLPAGGGQGTIGIQAERECAWSAAAQATWIALAPPAQGQGEATLAFAVQPNPAGLPRRGAVNVSGQLVDVAQAAAPCQFTVTPGNHQFGPAPGTLDLTVQGPTGCSWTAASGSEWITILQGNQGSGPGQVRVRIAENPGGERTGVVVAAGVRVEVLQRAAGAPDPGVPQPPQEGCTYALVPDGAQFAATGGDGEVRLETAGACSWTVTSDASWLALRSAASGTGAATISYRVSANATTSPRTGRLIAGGATFRVQQDAANAPLPACLYVVTPLEAGYGAAGGSGSVEVRTLSPCEWNAVSQSAWITVTSRDSGRGDGQVSYRVDGNTSGASRTGSLLVAGQRVTIRQEGAAADSVTLNGAVANLSGSCPARTFTVGGATVRTSSATTYRRGDCGKLKDGLLVTVTGQQQSDGVVDAGHVDFD